MLKSSKLWWQKLKSYSINGEMCHVHGLEDSVYLWCQTFPKLIKRFNVIPIKFLGRLFVEIMKLIVKYIWGDKGCRIAKTVLKRLKS